MEVAVGSTYPVLLRHLRETDVTEDTGVIDQDVDAAVCVDGGLDNLVALRHGVVISRGLASHGLDLGHDLIRRVVARACCAGIVHAAAQVVNNYFGAARAEQERVRTPKPVSSARNDHHLPIESKSHTLGTQQVRVPL
jgi:hypothetical protein